MTPGGVLLFLNVFPGMASSNAHSIVSFIQIYQRLQFVDVRTN
jgi:hypothetical protein